MMEHRKHTHHRRTRKATSFPATAKRVPKLPRSLSELASITAVASLSRTFFNVSLV